VWHVSLAMVDSAGVVRLRQVTNKARLYEIGRGLLCGVGDGETFEQQSDTTIHIRRSLSAAEIAGLDPAWLAIPAIDIAG
jgi:hypothetical protein